MTRRFSWLAVLGLAVAILAACTADSIAKDRDIALDKAPAKVKAAILKAARKNKVEEVEEIVATHAASTEVSGGRG